MKFLVLHPSSARLGSARIQLELEASQLSSAWLARILSQLVVQKSSIIELVLMPFFLLISFKLNILNFIKVNLNLMYEVVKRGVKTYIKL